MNNPIVPPVPADLCALLEDMPMLVWMTNAAGQFTYISPRALALAPALLTMLARDWSALIHPDDQPHAIDTFRQALERHEEYDVEYRILRPDGSARWLLESGAPRFDDDGSFAGFVGSTVDVSTRREAEQRLAQSEAAYRLLAEHASDLISHHALDGTYLFASPRVQEVVGLPPEQLIGHNAVEFVHPDDVSVVREALARLAAGGGLPAQVEFRMRQPDGRNHWVGTSARAILDPATGTPTALVAVSRDITAERNYKELLHKQELKFRSLTALSSDWYWETDADDIFTFVSDGLHATVGMTLSDVLGKRRSELVTDLQQPAFVAYQQHLAKREPFRGIEFVNGTPDGRSYVVRVSGEPVFENGTFLGYHGVTSDVTQQVEKQDRLARLAEENNAVIEQSLDLKLLVQEDGTILRANRASLEILGYHPEELIGKIYNRFIVSTELDATLAAVDKVWGQRTALRDLENRWLRKDGSEVDMLWSLTWSADSTLAYCTGRDVTERNRNRKALQRSNEKLNRVLETIGDGFFTIDTRWRIEYANETAATFLGVRREHLVGRTLWSAAPQLLNSSLMPRLRRAMESGESGSFEAYYEPRRAWLDVRVYSNEDGMSVFFSDASARYQAATSLWLSEQRFREVVEMNPAGYLLTDGFGRVQEVNLALCELCGFSQEELLGLALAQVLDDEGFTRAVQDGVVEPQVHGRESALRHKRGATVPVLLNASIQFDGDNKALSVTAFVTDITSRKRAELELKQQATHDVLTGLPNRAFVEEQLPVLLQFGSRDKVVAVMLLDLDGFKAVNDTLGHAAGDTLLCEVAVRLRRHCREGDIVARLGGDEFLLVAHCADGARSAAGMAEHLVRALAEPIALDGQDVRIGASIGISLSPQDGSTRDDLLAHADAAMYRAKAGGRNAFCFYDPAAAIAAEPTPLREH